MVNLIEKNDLKNKLNLIKTEVGKGHSLDISNCLNDAGKEFKRIRLNYYLLPEDLKSIFIKLKKLELNLIIFLEDIHRASDEVIDYLSDLVINDVNNLKFIVTSHESDVLNKIKIKKQLQCI